MSDAAPDEYIPSGPPYAVRSADVDIVAHPYRGPQTGDPVLQSSRPGTADWQGMSIDEMKAGHYKNNPPFSDSDQPRFKGAMGGRAVGDDYPDHEPPPDPSYARYKALEDKDPELYHAVNHVADDQKLSRPLVAGLVMASSGGDAKANDGRRVGLMGLTADDARQYDPEGHLDINNPIQNLYFGTEKWKRLRARYGGDPVNTAAAYFAGPDVVDHLLTRHPDDHQIAAPRGTFDFVNRFLGRESSGSSTPPSPDDPAAGGDGGGGDTSRSPTEDLAREAQRRQEPQRFVPSSQPVAPMTPTPPVAPQQEELRKPAPGYSPGTGVSPATQAILDAPESERDGSRRVVGPPNYNLKFGGTPRGEPDDTGYSGPMPATPPKVTDETGYARPAPAVPPTVPGADPAVTAALAPRAPDDTGYSGPTPPTTALARVPDYSRAFAPGAPLGTPPAAGSTAPPTTPTPAPTQGSGGGAPPPAAAPSRAARRPPTAALAPSTDNMANDLNRQELERLRTGAPNVPPSGPTQAIAPASAAPAPSPTADTTGVLKNVGLRYADPTATTGSGTTGPVAPTTTTPVVPGGGQTYAQPGPGGSAASTPSPTSDAPVDRLRGGPNNMTAQGVVRAAADGGPNGVLTYAARNASRGASAGAAWDQVGDLLAQAFIRKGDMQGAIHAQAYVFQMKHKGAMENLMQAIGTMESDPNTAAQYLARSHAFVTDGSVVGFQVNGNNIFGQKYDEQTHQKIGQPFQVTTQGLRSLAIAQSDPDKFFANLHNERTTNETIRHNTVDEDYKNRDLTQRGAIAGQTLEEKKLEYDITNKRIEEQKEADRQNRKAIADSQAHERQLANDQRQHDKEIAAAQTAAQEKAAHAGKVNEEIGDYYGTGGAEGSALDPTTKKPFQGEARTQARDIHSALRHNNPDLSPDSAAEMAANVVSKKYNLREAQDGRVWVLDENGKPLVSARQPTLRRYLPQQQQLPPGTPPTVPPRVQ